MGPTGASTPGARAPCRLRVKDKNSRRAAGPVASAAPHLPSRGTVGAAGRGLPTQRSPPGPPPLPLPALLRRVFRAPRRSDLCVSGLPPGPLTLVEGCPPLSPGCPPPATLGSAGSQSRLPAQHLPVDEPEAAEAPRALARATLLGDRRRESAHPLPEPTKPGAVQVAARGPAQVRFLHEYLMPPTRPVSCPET